MIHILCSACAGKGGVALQHGNIRNLRKHGSTYHWSFMSPAKISCETKNVCKMSVLLLHVMFKVLSFARVILCIRTGKSLDSF